MEILSRKELIICNGGSFLPILANIFKKTIYLVVKFNRLVRRFS